jgi:hypothetical protein
MSSLSKILLAGILVTVIFVHLVAAEELPSPGILPDNPIYPVKTFLEKVRLWLTFDPEARARFHAFLAEQRLSELNETIRMGKLEYVEKLKGDYEKEMNETVSEMNRTFGLGRNATALAEHVCNVTYKHVAVLERVLERAPEAAREGIERAVNASIKGYENCEERLEKILNETNESIKRFSCTSDVECLNLTIKCPAFLGNRISCFIPENRTTGFCRCEVEWKKVARNCTDDSECKELVCPMVLGNDTPVCLNGRCVCGAKWQLRNRTEWKERFGEEYSNVTESIQEIVRQKVEERSEIRRGRS